LLFIKLAAIELSVLIRAVDYEYSNYLRIYLMGIATFVLWKTPTISDSATEDTTCFDALYSIRIALFNVGYKTLFRSSNS